jgi:hypothetical protein
VFIVRETTSELETCDLVDPIICRCRKHQRLACQAGGFVTCFPLKVSMVQSPKLTFIANSNNLTGAGFILGETICFGSLEFTADFFGNLSLSPEGNDSVAIFIELVHNGSPSLHTILEESFDKGDTASGRGGNSGIPGRQGCNVVTPTVPIATTPPPEGTLVLLTIPTVPLRTAAPQPDTRLLPKQQQAYQEEQQA